MSGVTVTHPLRDINVSSVRRRLSRNIVRVDNMYVPHPYVYDGIMCCFCESSINGITLRNS